LLQDVGFDYSWKVGKDNQVIDVYFHHHFPKAVRLLHPTVDAKPSGTVRIQKAVTISSQLVAVCGSSGLRPTSQTPPWL
jgi:hypothetical protein